MDSIAIAVDFASIVVFILVLILGRTAVRAFKESRQAVTESASLLSVIVNALNSRIESSESILQTLRLEFDGIAKRSVQLEDRQSELQGSYLQVLRYLQDVLSNDKRFVLELEQLKSKFASIERKPITPISSPRETRVELPLSGGDLMERLTPTEQQTIGIMLREGPKAAPELGKRLRKSREHTARLMKKLYMEGYLDRESNHAPFRYRPSEKVRQMVDARSKQVTAAASERS